MRYNCYFFMFIVEYLYGEYMKKLLISMIKLYQKIPGNFHYKCRHIPTCSNYAIDAINEYGSLKGSFLAIKRILRCNPFGTSGYDPVIKKENKMKKKKIGLLLILMVITLFTTGCKQDNMDDIEVAVTNYPNEYIVNKLYGKHATINQVYPDGVDIDKYRVTKTQKKSYSQMELFVYTGLIEKERNLAVDLLDLNSNLKIIDTSYVLETDYSNEELWLNPSSLLMMAQNVRLGLKEYITSNVLTKEVDEAYNDLKIKLSELDADYRLTVENTDNKTILVSDSSLKFLEKFGLTVICIDSNTTDKELYEVNNLIKQKAVNYIYNFKENKLNTVASELVSKNPTIKELKLNKLDVISDSDRSENKDYIDLMNENLDLLKQELYQ